MSATDVQLDHAAWAAYFTRFMEERPTVTVSIEVESPQIGHQIEARDLLLESLVYDAREDVFEVAALHPGPNGDAVIRHLITHPVAVRVDSPAGILPSAVAIDSEDGMRTLVLLRAPASLSG